MIDIQTDELLKELREKLKMIEDEIDNRTKLAEGYRQVIADYENHGEAERGGASRQAPKEVRNNIVQIIREEAGPLHYKEIYERLRARGVLIRGQEPVRNVIAHMSIDERFENVGRGMWTLDSLQKQNRQGEKL